jgi:hypothetical protein
VEDGIELAANSSSQLNLHCNQCAELIERRRPVVTMARDLLLLLPGGFTMKSIKFYLIAGLTSIGLFVPPMTNADTEFANVTGCLMRGDRVHQYSLTDANGTTYGLVPGPNVVMKRHVGQKVAVTGEMIKGGKLQREAADAGKPLDNEYLRVTRVKRVDGTCP